MNIGQGFKLARIYEGVSQSDAAKQLHISQNYLSLIENNHATPSLKVLLQASKYYERNISFLLQELNR